MNLDKLLLTSYNDLPDGIDGMNIEYTQGEWIVTLYTESGRVTGFGFKYSDALENAKNEYIADVNATQAKETQ